MCGIAGVLTRLDASPQDLVLVRRMIAAIAHRGPDGVRLEQGPGFALAHARLSIIDLQGGWQPLHAVGRLLIGNGEIYNYLELIARFGLDGVLATGSDLEPLLHLQAPLGEDALSELRGMYALCLLGPDGVRTLARDPFGIKPLYVRPEAASGGGRLLFASEPRALAGSGFATPKVVVERAEELLALNYTLGTSTIFEGVDRVPPGATMPPRVDRAFVSGVHSPKAIGEAEALRTLDRVLEDSVMVHQRADVPYGLFLSGGVDSASIATLMSRLNARPVIAYTCGFEGPGASDERRSAERVARALDLDWRETLFTDEDFWTIAPQVAWALDEPTTDFATLPTYKLARAAKAGLTVVLTGEGGDELFAGYGRYRRALRPAWLGGRPAEPQIDAAFLRDGGRGALTRWREAVEKARGRPGLTPLQQAQAADLATWAPSDLLLKLDRCLMAHGLEGRTPFFDREVAAFAFHLPDRLKVRGRHGKWLLRRWLSIHCPAAGAWERKRGFTVPVANWIAPRAADLGRRLSTHPGLLQLCTPEAVRAVFARDDQSHSRWPLLFYTLWWTIHIQGASAQEAGEAVLG